MSKIQEESSRRRSRCSAKGTHIRGCRGKTGGSYGIRLEIMPDHVHLLVEIDPQYGIHRLIKQMKGKSSRILREEFPWLKSRLPTLWTNSYFVATIGGAPLEIVKQYIEQQKYV